MRLGFVAAMARRELRASRRRLALYGACMAVGLAALVALHGFRAASLTAVDAESRGLLGADLRLTSREPFDRKDAVLQEWLRELAARPDARVSHMTSFSAMALAERAGRTRMVQVLAGDGGFPFYGELGTEPAGAWELIAGQRKVLVDPALLIQLDTSLGEYLKLGNSRFQIAGTVTRSPSSIGLRGSIAPRVYLPRERLDELGLVGEGSLVEFLLYGAFDDGEALDRWVDRRGSELTSQRVRVETAESYRVQVAGSLSSFTRFLGLVGLTALLLGGIGVAAGVRVFAREKLDTAAVLRALGASQNEVLGIYLAQTAALGAASALCGIALGLGVQALLPHLLSAVLPIEVPFALEPGVLVAGFVLGVLLAALFGLWPLLELRGVAPLRALRRDFAAEARNPRASLWVGFALGLCLLAASLWQAPDWRAGLAFAGGFAAALGLLAAVARALMAALRGRVPRRAPYWLRQGVANLFRPRNHTQATVVAIGAGVFLIGTLQLVEHNLLRGIERDRGEDRPNLVLFDVQQDQLADVEARLAASGSVLEHAPLISARIARVGERSARDLLGRGELPRSLRWALGREYRLTYSEQPRPGAEVVEGEWWSPGVELAPGAPHPISLEQDLARDLGAEVGDEIVWEIQGVPVATRVVNLRKVDWSRLATNFFVVFAPGSLEEAPQSFVMLGRVGEPEARAALQRDLVVAHPNISALDVTVILRAVNAIVDEVGLSIRFMALFALATGALVLLAAVSTSRFDRARESLLLRTLGSDGATVRRIVASEHVALGTLAASVGLLLALVSAWALVSFWFRLDRFGVPAFSLLQLWAWVALVSLASGWANTRQALREPPLAGLRRAAGG